MSTTDQIYLATGLSPEAVAPRVAGLLGLETVPEEFGVRVAGYLPWAGEPWFGGNLDVNSEPFLLDDETPETYEASVMDGYDIVWDIGSSARDADLIHRAARQFFDAISAQLPWQALLVFNVGHLVAASKPGEPVVEFPAGTSADAPGRGVWAAFGRWP